MPGYQVRPFDEPSVPEIGRFLSDSIRALGASQGLSADDGDAPDGHSIPAGDWGWLLDRGNPARPDGLPPGEVIRDDSGAIVGMIGCWPTSFRLGDRRLLGLGAHNFFVDPSARMQGYMLFRRYLNDPRADFCYSTSINLNSGPLWSKLGGAQLPDSDTEYVLVLGYGPVLRDVATKRGLPRAVAGSLVPLGALAGLVMRARRPRGRLRLERCEDWDRLAAVAEQDRDPTRLTPERSAAILKYLYELTSSRAETSGALYGIHRFAGPGGEGWLAVAERTRGRGGRIRSLELLDAVWPRGPVGFSDILLAVVELAASRFDVISIRDRCAWGARTGLLGLRRHRLVGPEAFVFSQGRSGLPRSDELARIADLPQAFGT